MQLEVVASSRPFEPKAVGERPPSGPAPPAPAVGCEKTALGGCGPTSPPLPGGVVAVGCRPVVAVGETVLVTEGDGLGAGVLVGGGPGVLVGVAVGGVPAGGVIPGVL